METLLVYDGVRWRGRLAGWISENGKSLGLGRRMGELALLTGDGGEDADANHFGGWKLMGLGGVG